MFHVKFRRPPALVKLAPCGLFRTLNVNELLSVAVTLTKTTSPRLASIIVGTKVNVGGKLAVESEKKRFSYRFILTIMSAIMKLNAFALHSKSLRCFKLHFQIFAVLVQVG